MIPLKDDQPRYSAPIVNVSLITLNFLVFFYEVTLNRGQIKILFDQYALVPAHLWSAHSTFPPVGFTFLSSMFLHEGWAHVLGNMLFLFIFGDNVEDYLGHFKYLVFYLLSGFCADAAQIAIYPTFEDWDGRSQRGDRGSAGSVFHFVSASAGADVASADFLLSSAGVDHAGILVRVAISDGGADLVGGACARPGRGCRVGACGWIRVRNGDGEDLS